MSGDRAPEPGLSHWQNRFGVGLIGLALASAIPLASNRPSLWLLLTACIGFAAGSYHLLALWRAPRRRSQLRPYAAGLALAWLVPAYALLQTLPLPMGLVTPFQGEAALTGQSISIVPDATMLAALRFSGYLMFLALLIEIATRRRRVALLSRLVFLGITVEAAWALIALKLLGDTALWGEKTAYLGVATGSFVNRNSLATFLGFGLVLGVAFLGKEILPSTGRAAHPRSLLARFGDGSGLVLVAMLVILLALLATGSRLGLVSALFGVMVTWAALLWRSERRSWVLWAGLGVVALVWMMVAGAGQVMAQRALFLELDGAMRLTLYRQVLQMIATRPWAGFGLDGFGPAFEAFRAPPLPGDLSFGMAHNTYLTLWAELGVVMGSLPPLVLLGAAMACARNLWRRDGFATAAAAALGCLGVAAVHSLGDFSLEIPANVYVFLCILALGLARRPERSEAAGQ